MNQFENTHRLMKSAKIISIFCTMFLLNGCLSDFAPVASEASSTSSKNLPNSPNFTDSKGAAPNQIFAGNFSIVNLLSQSRQDQYVITRAQPGRSFYNYAPEVIYDNGLYHMYWCGGVEDFTTGDYILHAQSTSVNGPFHASNNAAANSYDVALQPTTRNGDFDAYETCDPSVIKYQGYFYLYYAGLGDQDNKTWPTEIGVAASGDGIHFSRLNGGRAIVAPVGNFKAYANTYGAGEPSVLYIAPYFYMTFTDTTGPGADADRYGQFVLRSPDPVFQYGVQELTANGWAARAPGQRTGEYAFMNAMSVDMAFDPLSGKIIVAWDDIKKFYDYEHTSTLLYFLDPTDFSLVGQSEIAGNWHDGPSIAKMADHTTIPRANCSSLDLAIYKGSGGTNDNVSSWNVSLSEGTYDMTGMCQLSQDKVNSRGVYLTNLYEQILGRPADPGGSSAWLQVMTQANGISCSQVAVNFVTSNEFRARSQSLNDWQFVWVLYRGLLYRLPDDGGMAYWSGALQQGLSRDRMVSYVLGSDEFNYNCAYRFGYPGAGSYAGLELSLNKFKMYNATSNDALWAASGATDENTGTSYSSNAFGSSANDRWTYLAAWTNGLKDTSHLSLTARMINGQPAGFASNYDVYVTSPDNTQWIYVGNFNATPDAQGNATISFGRSFSTFGVLIHPNNLGADPSGTHYIQLAEMNLAE